MNVFQISACTTGGGYRVSFPGIKRPGRGVNHPPLSSADVKERVELYLYSPSQPSCRLTERTLLTRVGQKMSTHCICWQERSTVLLLSTQSSPQLTHSLTASSYDPDTSPYRVLWTTVSHLFASLVFKFLSATIPLRCSKTFGNRSAPDRGWMRHVDRFSTYETVGAIPTHVHTNNTNSMVMTELKLFRAKGVLFCEIFRN